MRAVVLLGEAGHALLYRHGYEVGEGFVDNLSQYQSLEGAERAGRLRESVCQARADAGSDAALRVLEVDPQSRFPERRAVLTPFEAV